MLICDIVFAVKYRKSSDKVIFSDTIPIIAFHEKRTIEFSIAKLLQRDRKFFPNRIQCLFDDFRFVNWITFSIGFDLIEDKIGI